MADQIIDVERKTAQHNFFSCNTPIEKLFSVRAGVDVEDAINVASAILRAARETIMRLAEKHDDSELWGASYLLEMAAATMEAAEIGLMKESHHGKAERVVDVTA
ncbi:MAG: DUF3077 domain-containing protein [Dechloromonas sp.]|nr:MAG: DUF3077 domain-containing protein [Dechloromonas sp.]